MKRILCLLLALMFVLCPVVQAEETEEIKESYTVLKALRNYLKGIYQFGVTEEEFLDALIQNILEEKDDEATFEFVAESLTDALDKHSVYFTPKENEEFNESVGAVFTGIGIIMVNIDGYCTVTGILEGSPAESSGLSVGDRIIAVEGESVINTDTDLISSRIRGEIGTDVTITILTPDEQTKELRVTRDEVVIPSVSSAINEAGDTAYVSVFQFAEDTVSQFKYIYNDFKEKGINNLVLDLRDNTGGFTSQAEELASMFLKEGSVIYYESIRNYGREFPYVSKNENADLSTKIVVLTNEYTASAAEILTAALKENDRATIIGTNTFGKGTMQTVASLGDYGSVKVTFAEFFSPKKNKINEVGITPHKVVENEVRGVQESDFGGLSFKNKYTVGDENEEVCSIKERLAFLGLYSGDIKSKVFDSALAVAVSRFQEISGLYPYGVADINTQLTLHTQVMCEEVVVDTQLREAFEFLGTKFDE